MEGPSDIERFASLCARLDDPFADREVVLREAGLDGQTFSAWAVEWASRMRSDSSLAEQFRRAYRAPTGAPAKSAFAPSSSQPEPPAHPRPPMAAPASTLKTPPGGVVVTPSYLLGRAVQGSPAHPPQLETAGSTETARAARHDTDEVDPAAYRAVPLPFSSPRLDSASPGRVGALVVTPAPAAAQRGVEVDMLASTIAKMMAQHEGVGLASTAPLSPLAGAKAAVPFHPRAQSVVSVAMAPAHLAPQASTGTVAPLPVSVEPLPFTKHPELETYARLSAELALSSGPSERAAALAASGLTEQRWAALKAEWDPRAQRDAAIQAKCLEVLREVGKARK